MRGALLKQTTVCRMLVSIVNIISLLLVGKLCVIARVSMRTAADYLSFFTVAFICQDIPR